MDPTEKTNGQVEGESPASGGRRKRLSRKEHKARKKQKKQHLAPPQQQDPTTVESGKQPLKATVQENAEKVGVKIHKESGKPAKEKVTEQTKEEEAVTKKRKTLSKDERPKEEQAPMKTLSKEKKAPGNNQQSDASSPTTKENPSKKKKKKKHKKKQSKDDSKQAVPTEEKTEDADKTPSQSTAAPIIDEPYVATPIPTLKDLQKSHGAKPLGKWFPKAVIVKAKEPPVSTSKASLVLFYQYTDPLWPESVTEQLISYLLQIAQTRVLGGRIRVAREGVNCTLSSRDTSTTTAAATLRHFTQDLQSFHPVFANTDFKFIDQLSGDRHFKDFKVFPVKELVFYGLDGASAPLTKGGVHLSAEEFHLKLAQSDTVVVDVRNHYEAAIGRFDGQMVAESSENKAAEDPTSPKEKEEGKPTTARKGATYVDPKMRKSTDFATWLQKPETTSQLAGKQVLLYCTGGVRCERASAYVNQTMGDKLAGVYQLQGGIERYMQAFPEGGFWRGKNFVFDKREAFDVNNPDGDGGVVRKDSKKDKGVVTLPEMKCCVCQKPWDRYVGKKKCETCGVPVLMCDACMTSTKGEKKQQQQQPKQPLLIRCPLCVEENVTVPVQDVDWTDNGVTPVFSAGGSKKPKGKREEEEEVATEDVKKAAPSVLKWGGGHASQKKDRRRFQRQPCRFGADCKRSDCFFAHSGRGDISQDHV